MTNRGIVPCAAEPRTPNADPPDTLTASGGSAIVKLENGQDRSRVSEFLKNGPPGSQKVIDISIVVPVFNEAESLINVCQGIRRELTQIGITWELIFINDGSTDSTETILDQLAEEDQRVRVIHFKRNLGQTAAMMAGFDHARGEVIIPLDGDGQNDPADIPKMLEVLNQGYDVVSGWRKDRQDHYIQRNVPSILANKLISFVSGVQLHDFGCSLKAYKRHVVEGIRLYGEMHRFLPIYASWHGAKISEVVVNHYPRTTGSSKYGLERVLKVLLDLLVVKFLDRAAAKPMYVFGGCGIFSLAISLLTFLWMLGLKFNGISFIETPLPLIVVVTFMIAMMCILLGLLAEMITRTFYESQGKTIYNIRSTRNFQQLSVAPETQPPQSAREDQYRVRG
ncbi:MAG: glycosyltransferase family 2 protein [Verrucomicrobia bacterium]|nr:glycosyltransferase family 2 protein [Verrucomicrobiota bacterium]